MYATALGPLHLCLIVVIVSDCSPKRCVSCLHRRVYLFERHSSNVHEQGRKYKVVAGNNINVQKERKK